MPADVKLETSLEIPQKHVSSRWHSIYVRMPVINSISERHDLPKLTAPESNEVLHVTSYFQRCAVHKISANFVATCNDTGKCGSGRL